jgi:hypothetical protein
MFVRPKKERLQHASQPVYQSAWPAQGDHKPAAASTPVRAADHLRNAKEVIGYIQTMLTDGDALAVPIALRTVADALGAFDPPPARCDASVGTGHCWLYRSDYSIFTIEPTVCRI